MQSNPPNPAHPEEASLGLKTSPNYFSLALAALVSEIIVFAGSILIFIGALILATVLYLTLASSAIEGKSPIAALGRSRQLVSGRWFKTFALMIGTFLIVDLAAVLVADLISLPFSSTASIIVSNAVWNIVFALGFPLVSASMLVLYYTSRAAVVRQYSPPKPPPSPYDNMRPEPMGYFRSTPTTSDSNDKAVRRFCSSCGAAVTPDERFCHNCGAHQPASN